VTRRFDRADKGLALPKTHANTSGPVRSAPFLAILAIGVAALAEEPSASKAKSPKSQSLSQRLLQPDLEKNFNMSQLSPFGRSKSEFRAREARTNSFYFQQKFTAKGFETRSFRTKTAWDSDSKFETKDARTKTFETKSADVKAAPVKEAREARKSAPTREYYQANRTSEFKGRNQALFDKEGPAAQAKIGTGYGGGRFSLPGQPDSASWSGNLKQLTVDDVREILNKNK
jgi:hypothetical protein